MNLPGGDRPRGGVPRWTDHVIRRTLKEFFGPRSDWPSQREFDAAGLHGLREALRYHGGPRRWSREFGVKWTPRAAADRRASSDEPERAAPPVRQWPKWNEQTIAAQLKLFLAGREVWPRYTEFIERGRQDLYQAVLKHGGTHLWADRMGVEWVERYGGDAPRWTEERVRQRLTSFLQGRTVWPRPEEFAAVGERSLLTAVRRLGGVGRWTGAFGLEPLPRLSSQPADRHNPVEAANRHNALKLEDRPGTRLGFQRRSLRSLQSWGDGRQRVSFAPRDCARRWPLCTTPAAARCGSSASESARGASPGPSQTGGAEIPDWWRRSCASSAGGGRTGPRTRSSRPAASRGSTTPPPGTEESATGRRGWRSRRAFTIKRARIYELAQRRSSTTTSGG